MEPTPPSSLLVRGPVQKCVCTLALSNAREMLLQQGAPEGVTSCEGTDLIQFLFFLRLFILFVLIITVIGVTGF